MQESALSRLLAQHGLDGSPSVQALAPKAIAALFKARGLKLGERLRLESEIRRIHQKHGRPQQARSESLNPGWPDVYRVVHERVAVRQAPSRTAEVVDVYKRSDEVYAYPDRDHCWVRLEGEEERYILVDGRPHGLPLLMERRCSVCEPLQPLNGHASVLPPALAPGDLDLPDLHSGGPFVAGLLPGLPLEAPTPLQLNLMEHHPPALLLLLTRLLAFRAFVLCSSGLDPELLRAARNEAEVLHIQGDLYEGTVGSEARQPRKGITSSIDSSGVSLMRKDYRSDRMLFLNQYLEGAPSCRPGGAHHPQERPGIEAATPTRDAPATAASQRCPSLRRLDELLSTFAEGLGMHLAAAPRDSSYPMRFAASGGAPPPEVVGASDMQVTCYADRDARYRAHLDNMGGVGSDGRLLTLVCYLNQDWDPRVDGGALRVHVPAPVAAAAGLQPETTPFVDVFPSAGTLAIFRSDRVLHEVRPPKQARYAVTVWLVAENATDPRACYF